MILALSQGQALRGTSPPWGSCERKAPVIASCDTGWPAVEKRGYREDEDSSAFKGGGAEVYR